MDYQQASLNPRYIINSDGSITSSRTKQKIVKHINNSGYETVTLCVSNNPSQYKRYLVHRLVAAKYLGDVKGLAVNHIDGNKLNNALNNLEIVTYSQNMYHAVASGLHKIGEKHPQAKLTEVQVNQVCLLLTSTNQPVKDIAKEFRVAYSTINNIVQKHRWVEVSNKYWLGKLQRLGENRTLQGSGNGEQGKP